MRRAWHSDAEIDEAMNLSALRVRFASQELEETLLSHPRSHEALRARSAALREFARAIHRAVALRAIAEKYLENLEALKPLAGRIAYRTATLFESRPRHMQENWIFSCESSSMKDEAKSEILFAYCRDLRSGAWFESRRNHVLQGLTLMNREIFLCTRAHTDMIAVNADGSVSLMGGDPGEMPFYNPGSDDTTDALF